AACACNATVRNLVVAADNRSRSTGGQSEYHPDKGQTGRNRSHSLPDQGLPTVAHPGPRRQPLGWPENLPYNILMTGQFGDWRGLAAPSLADFEALAAEAYARLPGHFRKLCEGLIIRVEDFPSGEVLQSMQAESEFDLLGLFHGVGLPFQSE